MLELSSNLRTDPLRPVSNEGLMIRVLSLRGSVCVCVNEANVFVCRTLLDAGYKFRIENAFRRGYASGKFLNSVQLSKYRLYTVSSLAVSEATPNPHMHMVYVRATECHKMSTPGI